MLDDTRVVGSEDWVLLDLCIRPQKIGHWQDQQAITLQVLPWTNEVHQPNTAAAF